MIYIISNSKTSLLVNNRKGVCVDETENYILHKLESAGAATGIIGDGVLKAVYGYTRGNPRMIDNLMTDALTLGAQQNKHVVDTDTLLAAMNNQQLG